MSSNDGPPKKGKQPVPISLRSSTLQSLLRASSSGVGGKAGAGPSPKNVDLVAALAKPVLAKPVSKVGPSGGGKAAGKMGGSFGASFGGPGVGSRILPKMAPKANITFKPTIEKLQSATPKATPKARTDMPNSMGGITSQSLLAHRLALQGQSSVVTNRQQRQGGGFKVTVAGNKNLLAQANPRGRNRSRMKQTREIPELSFPPPDAADDVTQYRPISLPYFLPETQIDSGPGALKSQRPTLKAVDEANANAAALFDKTEEEIDWFLVQFPVMLPALNKDAMNRQLEEAEERLMSPEERAERARKKAHEKSRASLMQTAAALSKPDLYMHTPFSALPEGYLGKLEIRRSGRVVLRLGNHIYDVNSGSDCKFYQQVGIHIGSNNEFFFMGQCFKRMMITPHIQSMIKSSASKENRN